MSAFLHCFLYGGLNIIVLFSLFFRLWGTSDLGEAVAHVTVHMFSFHVIQDCTVQCTTGKGEGLLIVPVGPLQAIVFFLPGVHFLFCRKNRAPVMLILTNCFLCCRKRPQNKMKKSPVGSWRSFFNLGKSSSVSKRKLQRNESEPSEMKAMALKGEHSATLSCCSRRPGGSGHLLLSSWLPPLGVPSPCHHDTPHCKVCTAVWHRWIVFGSDYHQLVREYKLCTEELNFLRKLYRFYTHTHTH